MSRTGARLRILHCIPSFQSGGAERQLSLLAPAQVRLGADVHVAYIHEGQHVGELEAGGVRLHRIKARGNHDPRIPLELWRLTGSLRPDIVQSWIPLMDIAVGPVARLRRIPWVLSERSAPPGYARRFKDRVLRPLVGSWADAVVANSNAGGSIWKNSLRGGAEVHIVPNVIALKPIDDAEAASLKGFGVEEGQPAVIFVGRLSYEKNVEFLLRVAQKVCERSNATFLICGDGPLRRETERTVLSSPFRDRIRILGHRSDIWPLLKASRAFVSTSAFEGSPNAVLEAMACRCPLVVSDIPAHREFLGRDTADLVPLVETDFVEAILRAIAGGPAIRDRVSAARRLVESTNPTTAAAAYRDIYERITGRQKRCAA